MLGIEGIAGTRRARKRIAVIVGQRPAERQQRLYATSVRDLRALEELNDLERRLADEHLERVARSLGLS